MSSNANTNDSAKPPLQSAKQRKPQIRFVLRLGLIALIALIVAAWWLFTVAQNEPEFYRAALALTTDQAAEGDEFEKRLLGLQNDARTKQAWQAVFTEAQINGWITLDFPRIFPDVLPSNIADPRIAIAENQLLVAFRYHSHRLKRVIVVQGDVDLFCTEVPDQLAVQIRHVKSGLIPIPISSIADRVTDSLRRMGAEVEWTELDGDPVALINVPAEKIRIGDRQIEISGIQLQEKQLVLTGTSITIE